MTNRFERAVQALVSAYMNDTLIPVRCTACAVGNIVAAGYGHKLTRVDDRVIDPPVENDAWATHFICGAPSKRIENIERYIKGTENIAVTGYSEAELMKVEGAFMDGIDSREAKKSDDPYYIGLMATIDVLCEIEGIADAAEYKALFAGKVLAGA